jgi:glucose/arabinose dehydrogenase
MGAHAGSRSALTRALVVLCLVAGAAPLAWAADAKKPLPRFRAVVKGLKEPVYVTATPTEPGRLYVVEQAGRIVVVQNGRVQPTPFLDIRSEVESGGEQGLLSVAFHPNYGEERKIYVDYTDRNGDTRVVEYRVAEGRADPATARQLLFVKQPYANHNGGQLQFGPDGLLYVGMGDGGSAGDPEKRAQNLSSQLGKLLRTNVADATPTWAIAGYGLRNPWRFSFDRRTGDLWIGDVGQGDWEEIDERSRAQLPRTWNYGWSTYEGRARFGDHPLNPEAPLVFPVAVYSHSLGCSVTGGYVYRGAAVKAMRGRYVYGDFCSGRVWSLVLTGGRAKVRLEPGLIPDLSSFGENERGELYATSLSGTLYRLVR